MLAEAGLPSGLAALLARRGVTDRQSADRFLNPSLDQLHDPFLLAGMEAGVERLLEARRRGERVAIVGDYDVDGVTATALLAAVLRACGMTVEPILPNRLDEGYGFQPVHVERARAAGCGLIVTADCGSSAAEAVAAAHSAGLDVLITDHHLPGCDLPARTLHINPRQPCCTYPFPDLAAVGLALKLSVALAGRCGKTVDLAALLRIACLGTIADLVPLLGENRVIAALGLTALTEARSRGLQALIAQAGMKPPYTAADVGFRLGPRLNAAGRLHRPDGALELLLSRDAARATALASELDGWNRERQAEEMRVVEEARQRFASLSRLPNVLVAWSASWHKGVVGIAAGRIARELHRPTLLLSLTDGIATGSGRSIPGVALHGFLSRWQDRMARFGGHAQAVGLSVREEELAGLQGEWEAAAGEWPEALLVRRHEYELEVQAREVSEELFVSLQRLEPFGQGNPRPLLRSGPLHLAGPVRHFGKGHLAAAAIGSDGAPVELLGWRWGEKAAALEGRFEVLAHLEMDSWSGGPVLNLVDCRPA